MSWIINDEYFDMMHSNYPTISSDGTYVVFSSYTNNLVSGDTNNYNDIFVKKVDIGNQGILQFSATKYKINEKAGLATITVTRKNGSDGAVSVNYATNGGTVLRRDYTSVSGTLNWADGDSSDKTFTIDINNDVPEANETINLSLNNFTGTAFTCPQNTAELTIIGASNQDPINDIPNDTNTSVTYTPIKDNSEKAGDITFNKFMMELYQPLTDEPTGEYALFEADNFKLDILPGFNDVRIPIETIDTLGNPNSVTVNLISIVPGGTPLNTIIPVCVAAQIGATLTSDVEGTSFPAYSEDQHQFCIPSLARPKVAVLPGGKTVALAPDCYEVTLNTANTQKNGVLKITNNVAIDKNLCK
jgi:hypothetical protein